MMCDIGMGLGPFVLGFALTALGYSQLYLLCAFIALLALFSYWFFHGRNKPEHTAARRHFRERFAKRRVIALCGHDHCTRFMEWEGDGGRITQLTVNSVWDKEERNQYVLACSKPEEFGERRKAIKTQPNGKPVVDETELFEEYKPGLKVYTLAWSAGSYKMNVSPKGVTVDFYAGDSQEITHTFVLR